jgi:DNA helicase-2/ATP-dependent DNA helicase PcrA
MNELYFSSASDYGGTRLKKLSPFVIEALDKPQVIEQVIKTPKERIIDRFTPTLFDIIKEKKKGAVKNKTLNLSFFQVDDYLTCPLKYKYVHVLRVPIMIHHTIIYGKAIHDAVYAYNLAKKDGKKIPLAKLFEVFSASWRSFGFHSRSHEEERFRRGNEALKSFFKREEKSRIIPFYVEKDFGFVKYNIRIRGRFDRVDRIDGEIIIRDFKSSEIKKEEEAQKRAKESLQLSIYALASKEIFGKMPAELELHFLESGLVGRTKRTEKDLDRTLEKINIVAEGIRNEEFLPTPSYMACKYCAYTSDCPSTAVSR